MKTKRTWYPLTGTVSDARPAKLAAKKGVPVDPLTGPKLALAGRVVTMDKAYKVVNDGVVYIDKGTIVAVKKRSEAAPASHAGITVVDTGGTLFPGLIELHNHLSYNALPLWAVPKKFTERGQWSDHADYRPLVSGPMSTLGDYKDANGKFPMLPAITRYVECKCLLGGVTTTQGIMLSSNNGIQRYYIGIVRNVERTDDMLLPEAGAMIADVEAKNAKEFLLKLQKEQSCYLLHLSEGYTDPATPESAARKHFLALKISPDLWALTPSFAGIHSAGLLPEDFKVLAANKCSIVWSPLSNLLLYGGTARVEAAKKEGVTIGLGSDWSPTGSKNLLGELKVAWLYNKHVLNGLFKEKEIIAMATRNAADILKWTDRLGVLKGGALADLLVVKGDTGDPYKALLNAKESDLQLVMVNGIARYGTPALMQQFSPGGEKIKVGGQAREVFLEQETADPDVKKVSLKKATDDLRTALKDIAKLAKANEKPKPAMARKMAAAAQAQPAWTLALNETCNCGVEFAPRLPLNGPGDFTGVRRSPKVLAKKSPPLSTILKPIVLDALTVADDPTWLQRIEQQPNVPTKVRDGLRALYS